MHNVASFLKNRQLPLFASLFLLCVLVWGSSLTFDFVLDDHALIVENPTVKDVGFLHYHGTHGIYPPMTPRQANYWRPLFMGTLMADYALWHLNPVGFHLTNLLLHFLNVGLVYLLVLRLFGRERLAFAAAALFCVAPVHASVVSYISGRADLLAALFVLLSLMAFLSWRTTRRLGWYRISLACFVLGLLARENALLLLLLLPLVRSVRDRKEVSRRQRRLELAGFIAVGLLYVLARQHLFLEESLGRLGQAHLPWGLTLLNVVNVLCRYVRLIVWPHPLLPMRTTQWVLQPTPLLFACGLLLVFILAAAASSFIKKKSAWTLGILWTFLCLVPLIRLIDSFPERGAAMAENWLYLPLIGLCLTLALFMVRLKKAYPVFLTAAVLYGGVFAFHEAAIWKNDTALLERRQIYRGSTPDIAFQRGALLLRQGRTREALEVYARMLDDKTDAWRAAHQLGAIYRLRGEPKTALAFFERSVRLNPRNAAGLTQIASLRHALGEEAGMLKALNRSLEVYPFYPASYIVAGNWYLGKQEYPQALKAFTKAAALDPDKADGYVGAAVCLGQLGRLDDARRHVERALRRARLSAQDLKNLGAVLANMGRFEEAIGLWKRGLRLEPADGEMRAFLASAQAAIKTRTKI